jgi:hypothetical protein
VVNPLTYICSKVVESGDCLIWTGKLDGHGYGQHWVSAKYTGDSGRRELVYRIVWEEMFGEIPEGLEVMHLCDVPACVQPQHLRLGTHRENMLDAWNKGRM